MRPADRSARLVPLLAALVVLAAGCGLLDRGPDPREQARAAAAEFLSAWAEGDLSAAAALTDDPAAAEQALTEVTDGLGVTGATGEVGAVQGCGPDEPCTALTSRSLSLRALGEWAYEAGLALRRTDGEADGGTDGTWLVHWEPAVVHPALVEGARLARSRSLPPRAPVLDRAGRPLVEERPVVTVGVEPRRVEDPADVAAAMVELGVDPEPFAARVQAAPEDQFVEAVTLRAEVWAEVSEDVGTTPGIVLREGTRALAPSASFARAVLGTVGPATEEALAAAGPLASPVDQVGLSGLQSTYQQRLAGQPGGEVRLVRDDEVVEVLHTFPDRPGEPLRTGIDLDVQSAAEVAVSGAEKQTALVALDVASGEVLAAANAPEASLDRATAGQYPPGSTFKVVSASALLRAGLGPEDAVPCPPTTTIGGKRFKNYEFTEVPGADFRDAFAASCNTAFVALTDRLDDAALPAEAAAFGLGADWQLGVPSFSGSVPEPVDVVDEAAALIGQSRVLASPLAMASVAAAVASGQPRPPVLLPDELPAGPAGEPLPEALAAQLQDLMRAVVTEGTASALAAYGEVHAKTGTAEYGTEDPPRTHAWLIGYRGDLAFAVLVEDGASGSADAAPVVERFLGALDDG